MDLGEKGRGWCGERTAASGPGTPPARPARRPFRRLHRAPHQASLQAAKQWGTLGRASQRPEGQYDGARLETGTPRLVPGGCSGGSFGSCPSPHMRNPVPLPLPGLDIRTELLGCSSLFLSPNLATPDLLRLPGRCASGHFGLEEHGFWPCIFAHLGSVGLIWDWELCSVFSIPKLAPAAVEPGPLERHGDRSPIPSF